MTKAELELEIEASHRALEQVQRSLRHEKEVSENLRLELSNKTRMHDDYKFRLSTAVDTLQGVLYPNKGCFPHEPVQTPCEGERVLQYLRSLV